MVEHLVANEMVAGSNLVSRSSFKAVHSNGLFHLFSQQKKPAILAGF